MAEDSNGLLYVAADKGQLGVYQLSVPPLSGTNFVLTVPVGMGGSFPALALAVDASNNLYVSNGTQDAIDVYTAPVSAASAPAYMITNGISSPSALCFDPSGNLFALDDGRKVTVLSQPYNSSSAITFQLSQGGPTAIACDTSGDVLVADGFGSGRIDVFRPPYTAGSTPAFSIPDPIANGVIDYMQVDSRNNLWMTLNNGNQPYLIEFQPPLSSSSTPAIVYTALGQNAGGLALGK